MNAGDWDLRTARLELTPLTAEDIESVWPSMSDPKISARMSWNAHQNKDETLAFLKRIEDDFATGVGLTWGIRMGREFSEFSRSLASFGLTGLFVTIAERSPAGARGTCKAEEL